MPEPANRSGISATSRAAFSRKNSRDSMNAAIYIASVAESIL
jgi:hypothetical protein